MVSPELPVRVFRPRRSADRGFHVDVLLVGDWETVGRRGRAGQENPARTILRGTWFKPRRVVLQRHVRQLSMSQAIILQELKSFLRISIRTWLMDQNPCETSHFLAIGVGTSAEVLGEPTDARENLKSFDVNSASVITNN